MRPEAITVRIESLAEEIMSSLYQAFTLYRFFERAFQSISIKAELHLNDRKVYTTSVAV